MTCSIADDCVGVTGMVGSQGLLLLLILAPLKSVGWDPALILLLSLCLITSAALTEPPIASCCTPAPRNALRVDVTPQVPATVPSGRACSLGCTFSMVARRGTPKVDRKRSNASLL